MGEQLNQWSQSGRAIAATCIALLVIAAAVLETRVYLGFGHPLLALLGLVAVLCLHDGHLPAVGLNWQPQQGWLYWIRWALYFGGAIAVLIALCMGVYWAMGWKVPLTRQAPTFHNLVFMCVYAPVSEEIIYRSLLTVVLLARVGPTWTIVLSGLIFGSVHILQGTPGPDNLVAGFMLQWAFLKSRTILVPITMHSGGNFFAFVS